MILLDDLVSHRYVGIILSDNKEEIAAHEHKICFEKVFVDINGWKKISCSLYHMDRDKRILINKE